MNQKKRVSRAEDIVRRQLLEPFREKTYRYIGMEFEFPVICMGREVSFKETGSAFLAELIENYGYEEVLRGSDGYLVRVGRDGDAVSFDFSYSLFELSMGKQRSLWEIQGRMLPILRLAQNYYRKRGCMLTGMGTRPDRLREVEYTYDPFYIMIRQFVSAYAGDKDTKKYFPYMCSVQTHIDIPYESLLETYNLFNRLDFVRGLLFANSLGEDGRGRKVLCVRDSIWENCGIPNTGIYDVEFDSMEALAKALAREKIFVRNMGEGLAAMKPQTLEAYFRNPDTAEEDFRYFRSFRRVVLNSYHVLEVRGDCTQPVAESLVTAAFHVGIAYNYQPAALELKRFFEKNRIEKSNSRLRMAAISGKKIAGEEELKTLLAHLLDIAEEGLTARGYGEEALLEPLRERAARLTNPAREMERALSGGGSMEELIERYA